MCKIFLVKKFTSLVLTLILSIPQSLSRSLSLSVFALPFHSQVLPPINQSHWATKPLSGLLVPLIVGGSHRWLNLRYCWLLTSTNWFLVQPLKFTDALFGPTIQFYPPLHRLYLQRQSFSWTWGGSAPHPKIFKKQI